PVAPALAGDSVGRRPAAATVLRLLRGEREAGRHHLPTLLQGWHRGRAYARGRLGGLPAVADRLAALVRRRGAARGQRPRACADLRLGRAVCDGLRLSGLPALQAHQPPPPTLGPRQPGPYARWAGRPFHPGTGRRFVRLGILAGPGGVAAG